MKRSISQAVLNRLSQLEKIRNTDKPTIPCEILSVEAWEAMAIPMQEELVKISSCD